jgi:hypothetical protein
MTTEARRTRRLRNGRRCCIQVWCSECGARRFISSGEPTNCPCTTRNEVVHAVDHFAPERGGMR